MSGGTFNYHNDSLKDEIFPFSCNTPLKARNANPFGDRIVSEIVYDVLELIHAYDYYAASDIGEEAYRAAVKDFKDKWLSKKFDKKYCKEFVTQQYEQLYKNIMNDLNIEPIRVFEPCTCGGGRPSFCYKTGGIVVTCFICTKEAEKCHELDDAVQAWNQMIIKERKEKA